MICRQCGKTKRKSSFYPKRRICKKCFAERYLRTKRYVHRTRNPDKYRARDRRWAAKNRERVRQLRREWRQRNLDKQREHRQRAKQKNKQQGD